VRAPKALVLPPVLAALLALGIALGDEKEDQERSAMSSLRAIASAEEAFQSGDKGHHGTSRYATLSELSTAGLIDSVLGSGTKDGYAFSASGSTTTSEFLWWATASPKEPKQGSRWFFMNQSGVVMESSEPLAVDSRTCAAPKGAEPVDTGHGEHSSRFCTEMGQLSDLDISDPHAWEGVSAGQVYVFHAARPERCTVTVAITSRTETEVAYTVTETPESGSPKAPEDEVVKLGTASPPTDAAIERASVQKEALACSGVTFECQVQDVRIGNRKGRFWVTRRFPFVMRIVDSEAGTDLLELVDIQDRDTGVSHCSCGARFEPGARFCAACGKERPKQAPAQETATCKSCGAKLPSHARFCPQCGKPCP
jgi:hypothetical protein